MGQAYYKGPAGGATLKSSARKNMPMLRAAGGGGPKVAGKGTNKLEYMGGLEMGGYRHDITGGNDGGISLSHCPTPPPFCRIESAYPRATTHPHTRLLLVRWGATATTSPVATTAVQPSPGV